MMPSDYFSSGLYKLISKLPSFKMGCGSSSNQMDNVVPPSSNYIVSDQKVLKDISINAIPEVKSNIQIEGTISKEQLPTIQQAKQLTKKELTNEVEAKKQQDRVMTAATQELKHEAMKHVPEGKAFIFGQSENQRKILLLDCQKMQFSLLSNRTQMPNTPNKYQPKDVIFQQSQEMLASSLFNNNSRPPYNFMFITFISDETIFLSGGVNFNFDYVSDEAFYFRVASIANEQPQMRRKKGANNLVGNKFQKLLPMKQKRYSHMGAYFKVGKLGYIYVFGGRGQDQQLLTSCEQYSIEQKKWRQITPMKHKRSTGFTLIFKNKIYVFGGYTGDKKRSKTIQVYDPSKNYWEFLNVKIHRGIEVGLIFSVKPNEILIMGGNMESGSLKSVIRVNLAQQTYIWDSNMKNDRLLQKGIKFNDTIYVFGGDFQDNFEKYTFKDRKWKDHQFSYNQFISIDDINSYQMATQTLQVPFDEALLPKPQNNANDFERYHIFGTDNFPVILELNLSKWVLKKKVVPMAMRLRCHMGVAKVVEGKYFVCGGIDSLQEKPSKASYIYYAGTNKAIQVAKMSSKKYNFAICATPKNVYIFGGKNETGEILNQCQKFSFQEEKWVALPNLPNQRCNAKALIVGSKILLFGGIDMLQTVTSIDIFDMETETFWHSKQSLSMPAEIKAVFLDNKEGSSPGVYIFSHNEVLAKYYCQYLKLDIPAKGQKIESNQKIQLDLKIESNQKIQQDFEVVKEIEQKQINIKMVPFNHAFNFNGKISIITSKGLFNWQQTTDQKAQNKFQSQIVINQVEMLQFPTEKFSSPTF